MSEGDLEARVAAKAQRLDAARPLAREALEALRHALDVELTYASNAIEGNTLTLRETAEVIEHGLTVGGKPLRDHLEAADHYAAVQWMRAQAAAETPLGEATVTELHRRIVARSQPGIAGVYSSHPRRVAGSPVVFPNPAKLPNLMEAFGAWLAGTQGTADEAFAAHFRLTAIHPFSDGNGRTARLLANLMLLRGGYPVISVRPEDRLRYLQALEHASLQDDLGPFRTLMLERLEAALDTYLEAIEGAG